MIAVAERADLRRQSDNLVFAEAQREEYTIVTENVADFVHLGLQRPNKAGHIMA